MKQFSAISYLKEAGRGVKLKRLCVLAKATQQVTGRAKNCMPTVESPGFHSPKAPAETPRLLSPLKEISTRDS